MKLFSPLKLIKPFDLGFLVISLALQLLPALFVARFAASQCLLDPLI